MELSLTCNPLLLLFAFTAKGRFSLLLFGHSLRYRTGFILKQDYFPFLSTINSYKLSHLLSSSLHICHHNQTAWEKILKIFKYTLSYSELI